MRKKSLKKRSAEVKPSEKQKLSRKNGTSWGEKKKSQRFVWGGGRETSDPSIA